MSCDDFFFAQEQLRQHHSGQSVGVSTSILAHPVDAKETSKHHITVVTCDNSTGVEFVTLQSIGSRVVIKTIGKGSIFMAAIDHDT